MYFGQVLYEVKRPGVEWCMRVIFSRDLNKVKTVYCSIHCVYYLFSYNST